MCVFDKWNKRSLKKKINRKKNTEKLTRKKIYHKNHAPRIIFIVVECNLLDEKLRWDQLKWSICSWTVHCFHRSNSIGYFTKQARIWKKKYNIENGAIVFLSFISLCLFFIFSVRVLLYSFLFFLEFDVISNRLQFSIFDTLIHSNQMIEWNWRCDHRMNNKLFNCGHTITIIRVQNVLKA